MAGGKTFARDAYRALVTLLDEAARTEPSLPAPVSELPERVYPTGFEFIEFAADKKSGADLTKMLTALRFRMERRHISKSVVLWRQGAINVVVNTEAEGFAAEAFKNHGPSVCDLGLKVKDANQTVARATALGAPQFSQPVGTGELDIPAIKGVGGNVVHFIDEKSDLHRVWDIEFDAVPKPTRHSRQAEAHRHVAQDDEVPGDAELADLLHSTFEMEKSPIVDVADPSGIVLSQAIASPEGEVRLNLNGAGERTRSPVRSWRTGLAPVYNTSPFCRTIYSRPPISWPRPGSSVLRSRQTIMPTWPQHSAWTTNSFRV